MSTTESTATGACLVCGKESTLRCSKCFTEGGISIPFCSKEHQKLIWPYHRLVCGERAHPFCLPPFDQREAMLVLGRAYAEDGPAEARLALRTILNADSMEPVQLKAKIDSLIGVDCPLSEVKDSTAATSVLAIRANGAAWLGHAKTERLSTLSQIFVEKFCDFYDKIRQGFETVNQSSLWWSEMCHRHIAAIALKFLLAAANNAQDQLRMHKLRADNIVAAQRFFATPSDPAIDEFRTLRSREIDYACENYGTLAGTDDP
ncbi:hypothetical protein JCM10908_000029 [Rhodotorula pacifica]|uniref:zinc finger MYND domain-containing protein n=1 Tax=Rhodotorula pacifica TaxID=1495444 RepID=UPI003181A332